MNRYTRHLLSLNRRILWNILLDQRKKNRRKDLLKILFFCLFGHSQFTLGYIFLIFVTFVIGEANGEMGLLPLSWSKKPWKEKRRPLFIAGLIIFLSCFVAPFFCRSELYDETVKSRFIIEQLSKDYNLSQAENMQVGFTLITRRNGGKNSPNAHLTYEYKAYVSFKFGNKKFRFYNVDFEDERVMISVIEKYKDALPLELKRKHLDGFVTYNGADESLRLYIKELFEEK